ncbi:alpha/beta fold hydrolase [Bacillus massiliglaciei]|uniref:alpha/beta fold hydrolase n=1 Tax=Bacillus massiliglaciei TaxID=1816693 RepID=UPI000A60DA65|nr:alpha/beta hydrolase [Bacillus massiliglaciei]
MGNDRNDKKKRRLWILFRNGLLAAAVLAVIWVSFNHIIKAHEQKKYAPIGQLVEVHEKKMHVYTKGKGDNTIILLSGLGTPAPALDYEPLINELAKQNKVAVVEPFGYGWSDSTSRERTVENMTEEIRTALQKLNIQGPYILMPHSISGIYSMYYANLYPDEVKAVIGVDPTLPQAPAYFDEAVPIMPEYLRYAAPAGVARLALYFIPDDFLPIAPKGTYSEENLKMTKAITAWKGNNKNVVDEANEINQTIAKTENLHFPQNMPLLIFAAEKDKEAKKGQKNVAFYETQLTNSPASKIILMNGHHYLHWTRSKEMSKEVNEFLESLAE